MSLIKFTGIIETGNGHGKYFLEMPWVKNQIIEKMNFTPFPGTLNAVLNKRDTLRYIEFIKNAKATIIEPIDSTYFYGKCIKTLIEKKIKGSVIIPLMPSYPKNKVEIISSINLREHLKLVDGDEVSIYFEVK